MRKICDGGLCIELWLEKLCVFIVNCVDGIMVELSLRVEVECFYWYSVSDIDDYDKRFWQSIPQTV